MSASELDEFYVHALTVETFQGTNGYGEDIFAAPVVLTPPTGCFIEPKRRLVRSSTGEQVVSETTVYTYPANAALFAPSSRVTINGTVSRVIVTAPFESGDLDLPDHVVINLT
ncbi:hypothetical protein [Agromyces ramosus]|uniref:Minor capsid protein n=1 Tax=Agromyces ramosus TaxID=33879 RepID=A0ABU0RBM7_9MICO|nr:hypothetical protein [Agromyces ramosus]MDQ0894429.1 hypothetical protein [Agromyces ramosus]